MCKLLCQCMLARTVKGEESHLAVKCLNILEAVVHPYLIQELSRLQSAS